jgi:hypothetical protein
MGALIVHLGFDRPTVTKWCETTRGPYIASIRERGPGLVALSGHDSSSWTLDAFGQAFEDRYRTLRLGEEITITAE